MASTATDSTDPVPPPRTLAKAALARRLGYVMLIRVVLFTLVLGGTVAVNFAWGTPEELGGPSISTLFIVIAAIYGLNIIYAVLLRLLKRVVWFAAIQIGVDLLASTFLVHFTGGAESGFVFFFLLAPIAAAVLLHRRAAIITAIAGAALFTWVAFAGYYHWFAVPGQFQLPPWELTAGSLGRGLLVNISAMLALAILGGYLAQQLHFAAEEVEVQQARIEDLSALHADVIRCLTSGLITINTAGEILTINQAAGEILGVPHDENAVGEQLHEISPALAAAVPPRPEAWRAEVSLATPSGKPQLLGLSVSPLTDHLNAVHGTIINFQDLTVVRQMEEAVKRSEHLASLGRMAAGIAHEIRNPLASISGSLELLRAEDELQPDNRKLMDIALREIERLDGLITSFLAYARPKPPNLIRLDLGEEIHALILSVAGLLVGQQAPAVRVTATQPGLWIDGDPDQLRAILWNLVRNAWEAGELEQVSVRVLPHPRALVAWEVSDRGCGIPAEHLPRIFEPFYTTKERGTGLGLATVHRMIQGQGGSVEVQSAVGKGTTVTILLPQREAQS